MFKILGSGRNENLPARIYLLTPTVWYIGHLRTREPVREQKKNKEERRKEKNSGVEGLTVMTPTPQQLGGGEESSENCYLKIVFQI